MAANVDWRDKGFKPRVRNQGSSPYCSMMATAAVIEGVHYIQTGEPLDLSEQQLLNSLPKSSLDGINSTTLVDHLNGYRLSTVDTFPPCFCLASNEYIKQPYKESEVRAPFVFVEKLERIYPGKEGMESAMIKMLNEHPILGCMTVLPNMLHYEDGIYGEKMNHFIVLMGYGVCPDTQKKYWLVLNSWGEKCGDKGYYKIHRGSNIFRMEERAWFPVLGRAPP